MSFIRYTPEDSVISSETVIRGLFSGDNNTLNSFYTASNPTEYYVDVYNGDPASSASAVQFSIQYGNLFGSGSALINTLVTGGYTPSRVVYGEYRNLVFGTETQDFIFDNGSTTGSQIFILNFSRARYKESLQPGSFNMTLGTGSSFIRLTDDSNTTSLTRFIGENEVYYIISGSNGNAYTPAASSSYYGMMFPDLNIIVLNAVSGSATSVLPFVTGSANLNQSTSSVVNNHLKLFASISQSATVGSGSMTLQSSETVSSRYFFTRVKNSEFNYTTNPSIIDANGNLLYTTLINNPQTFITTVGMYNDNNELLAVAKLSQPLTKDFTKEALIRIKLDY
jgi:hypothetical protein